MKPGLALLIVTITIWLVWGRPKDILKRCIGKYKRAIMLIIKIMHYPHNILTAEYILRTGTFYTKAIM